MNDNKAINQLTSGVFVVMFTMSVCNTIQGTILPDLINHYQLKAAMQGAIGTFQSIGSLIAVGSALPY